MFADPESVLRTDADVSKVLAVLAVLAGGSRLGARTVRHGVGVYEIGHFSFGHQIGEEWEGYFDTISREAFQAGRLVVNPILNYGVCDSIEQFLGSDCARAIAAADERYCVSFTHVRKVPGSTGGWRWHKWGPYIGTGEPTCEYLADEEKFNDGVYTFHVFRNTATVRNRGELSDEPFSPGFRG